MITRRALVRWSLAAPALLAAGARVAAAAPVPGRLYEGTALTRRRRGALAIHDQAGFVRLGRRIRTLATAVFSIANTNDRFVAVAQVPAPPKAALYLAMPDGTLRANSWGTGYGNNAQGSVSFDVDRALADEIAALWRVVRRDRVRLGAGLVGRWRARAQPFAIGKPMEIVLEIENTDVTTVGISVGGRQRGARDNRFAFIVEQAGLALPAIDAPDFGGVMGYRQLKTGERFELAADLSSWAKIDKPGAYTVRCHHEVELVPGDQSPAWPDHGHETWDLGFEALLAITAQ